jgi:formamidopyrimidine-DNA glycosylase
VPELPEVETIRRALEPVLVGRRFERVEILDRRLVRPFEPLEVAAELEGERVAAVDRRGKYLIVRFDSGRVLLVHLRMTGSFRYGAHVATPADDPHVRAVVNLDDGSDVAYRDVRRFGTWLLIERDELDTYFAARIGGEPLDRAFTARALAERLANRRAPLKAAILDQRVAAGVGNIYADEALWRARLHPLREARTLDDDETRELRNAIRRALQTGIRRQGASLRDYAGLEGERGEMQHEFKVYGRDGEPCDRCGELIAKTRVGGRGTWYCPRCQR